jgi:hypothetical protein
LAYMFMVPRAYLLIHRHIEWRQVALTQKATAEADGPDSVTGPLVCGVRAEFNPYGTRPTGALGTSSAQLRIGFG